MTRKTIGTQPRVAIVHEWLTVLAGSEKVLEQFCLLYPDADLYVVYADPEVVASTPYTRGRKVQVSFIQHLPRAAKSFRSYLALMPLAVEQFDLSGYDLIISSSHAVAKGVLTGPDQLHISYVHSPMRYAWDLQHQYLNESKLDRGLKSWVARWMLHKVRLWDHRTAHGVDWFVANSSFIGRRIRKVYGRSSDVIYPPVDVEAFTIRDEKEDFYLTASRMVPYKRMDLIVEAFAGMPDKRLIVIGDGPERERIAAKAGPNVTLLGYQPFDVLKDHMQRAKAFVFAAEEDFGIIPVEAQACGTPVIAFGKGGALETVCESTSATPTGVLFAAQTVDSLQTAVAEFEQKVWLFTPSNCRKHAERFSIERFQAEIKTYVDTKLTAFAEETDAAAGELRPRHVSARH
jgi:glycosyltransferase involved in cell wall biosynthesis